MTIRERVIELAKSQDMKQSELADAIKAPRSTVNGWFKSDKRNPSAEYILPICKLFNVDVEWLLAGKEGLPKVKNETQADILRWYEGSSQEGQDIIKHTCLTEFMKNAEKAKAVAI